MEERISLNSKPYNPPAKVKVGVCGNWGVQSFEHLSDDPSGRKKWIARTPLQSLGSTEQVAKALHRISGIQHETACSRLTIVGVFWGPFCRLHVSLGSTPCKP